MCEILGENAVRYGQDPLKRCQKRTKTVGNYLQNERILSDYDAKRPQSDHRREEIAARLTSP